MSPHKKEWAPRIAITMGDPCGVGPEIIVKALSRRESESLRSALVVGDFLALQRAATLLKTPLNVQVIEKPEDLPGLWPNGTVLLFSPCRLSEGDIHYGNPGENACRATVQYIEWAVRLAMERVVDGICTCPINKANLQRHGFPFPGHTEFLKELTGAMEVVMMLAGPQLRVSLVTIHEPLAKVPGLLNRDLLRRCIAMTGDALLRDFGIREPKIAVAGLNPHAGEEGRFGSEEIRTIRPVVESFANALYRVSGPYPPDTVFYRATRGEFDAVVSMYHDQGLIPIKLLHFEQAVNVTLGLPLVRTSVDHGTAYDLAGTGKAHEGSLVAAIQMAVQVAGNRWAFGTNGTG